MQVHDVVALTRDVPATDLRRGQVGTIVDVWQPGVFEVEFADLDGCAYAMAAVEADALMPLRFRPAEKAA